MKRYPKQKYPTERGSVFEEGRIFIQEKLDGSNGRFWLEEHLDEEYHTKDREIVFGTRRMELKNKKDETNKFADAMEYVRDHVDVAAVRDLEEELGPLVFFGEYIVPHTIQEYRFEQMPDFIGFDVWMMDTESFVEPQQAAEMFEQVGLTAAPFIEQTTATAWKKKNTTLHDDNGEIVIPESAYGPVKAEGVMFKNPDTNTYAKYVRDDFKERNHETFGSVDSDAPDAVKLSRQYITNARITKAAHRMIDDPKSPWDHLTMEMMEPRDGYNGLPEVVIRDMADEEGGNIFMSENYEIDLHEFRSDVSSRCATVLRAMINESVAATLAE